MSFCFPCVQSVYWYSLPQRDAGRINIVTTVLAESSKYFIIGKEISAFIRFLCYVVSFLSESLYKTHKNNNEMFVSFTDICISAFPRFVFFYIECKIIQSLFWAPQFKTSMGIVV